MIQTMGIHQIQPFLKRVNLLQCETGLKTGARRLYNQYFLYVHSGKGRVEVSGNWYDAVPGDMFYCAPGITNTIEADSEQPFLLSGIDFDFTREFTGVQRFSPIQAEFFIPEQIVGDVYFSDFPGFPPRMSLPEDQGIRNLILEMVHQFKTKILYHEYLTGGLLQAMIIRLVQHVLSRKASGKSHERGEKILAYAAEGYMREITNEEIGKKFHYHPDHVSRIVRSLTGMTLRQYIIDLRVRAAIDLLLNTDLSIGEVAVRAGYPEQQYFTRIFKSKTGYAPGFLRKHIKEERH